MVRKWFPVGQVLELSVSQEKVLPVKTAAVTHNLVEIKINSTAGSTKQNVDKSQAL